MTHVKKELQSFVFGFENAIFPSYWKSLICHDWRINCKLIAYNSMNEFLPGAEFGLSSSINWLFSSLRMENQIFYILISLSLVEDQIIWRRRKSLDFQNGWKIKYLKKSYIDIICWGSNCLKKNWKNETETTTPTTTKKASKSLDSNSDTKKS